MRKQGPPADIGTFQFCATAMVFQFNFSGVTFTVAMASGVSGWVLIAQSAAGADDVEIQAAIDYVGALGGGSVFLQAGDYSITATLNIAILGTDFYGASMRRTYITLADNSDCDMIYLTGTNCHLHDFLLDGNGANQAAGHGITMAVDGLLNPHLNNIYVVFAYQDGVQWSGGDGVGWAIYSEHSGRNGFSVVGNGASRNVFSGCGAWGNIEHGWYINALEGKNFLMGCISASNEYGYTIYDTTQTSLIGGGCWLNEKHGIWVYAAQYNIIQGLQISNNSQETNNTYDGIYLSELGVNYSQYNIIKDNQIFSDEANRHRYGINEQTANEDYNTYKDNIVTGAVTGVANILGLNNRLPTLPIQLIQGTTFISTADEAWGWQINADTNFALGTGWLPSEVQQVVRIRVIGVALAAPGAGDYMRIQITGEGATFDEVFTTEPIDVVDHNNEEVNVAIDDVVNWIFDATDDADIGQLLGGDRLQIKVLHEGAGNGNIATDAIVDSIQVEYV